jgi:hypothetical protein
MKTLKKLTLLSFLAAGLFMNCKKEPGPKGDTGSQGPQGPAGPSAKTFTFALTFDPGETFESYSPITGFNADDVLLVYAYNNTYSGSDYYTQLPYIADGNPGVNFWPEFNENTGFLFINTTWSNGNSGSPWTSATTLKFKAVLISSSQFKAHPGYNWENFELNDKN